MKKDPEKPRVLLDCDGVLADFARPVIAHINELMGTSHTLEDLDQWDIMGALNVPPDVADEAYGRVKAENGCYTLPVYDGAKDGVRLLEQVADVYIVTSPMQSPHWADERRRWLTTHFGIGYKRQVQASAKELVAGDFLIDDKSETLWLWAAAFPNGVPVLWHHESNRFDMWPHKRTRDWQELRTFVAQMAPYAMRHRIWTHG